MSELAYSDYEDILVESSRPAKKDKKVSMLKVIVLVLAILLVFEAIIYTLVIPCMSPVKIEFRGLKTLSAAELGTQITGGVSSPWMKFDTARAVSVLSNVSAIETVSVDKRFPDRVVVLVKEREAVAKTVVSVNDRSIPVQIDRNGVLFTSSSLSYLQDSSVPLLSGLPVDAVQDGMRLPAKYRTLMEQIEEIRELKQRYFAAISEIQVVPKEYGNYELVLYPIQTKVRVLTDRSLNEEALQYMMVVLDVVNSIEPDVEEIDLRYGSVSYRRRTGFKEELF